MDKRSRLTTSSKPRDFPSLSLNGSLLRGATETIDSFWMPGEEKGG
jgi:hypothetical protein